MQLIECPRDAMQGIKTFIPTATKIDYLNLLLKAGFHTLDFGSFVSPKAVPQMQDTSEVLKGLDLTGTQTRLLAIVANLRGARDAVQHDEITYLGYPFSVSETFQQRNANRTIKDSITDVEEIQSLCAQNNKKLVVYISMAFGNPYGDEWSPEIVKYWAEKLKEIDVKILALSDTAGDARKDDISGLFETLIAAHPEVTFGAHFHARPENWREKVEAAYNAGCRRFDSAVKGYGGCPMAKDELVGNVATENLLQFLKDSGENTGIDEEVIKKAAASAPAFMENQVI